MGNYGPEETRPERKPSAKGAEQYWIRLREEPKGPFDPEDIAVMPGVGVFTLLCPGRLDPAKRRNWRMASEFPAVRRLLERPAEGTLTKLQRYAEAHRRANVPAAPRATQAALTEFAAIDRAGLRSALLKCGAVLAALGAWAVAELPKAPPPPKPPAAVPREPWKTVFGLYLPACRQTVREKVRGALPALKKLDADRYAVEWFGAAGRDSLKLEFDRIKKVIRPLNAATAELMDARKRCR